MGEEMMQIAARIRELREISELTQEQMAAEVGVDAAQYIKYEESGEDIPISVLYHIAQKFRVDMNELLTGKPARLDTYEICRRGKGRTIDRYEGYMYEGLAPRFINKIMEPLLVTLMPTGEDPVPVTHKGQEFNIVLEGTVVVAYDGMEHTLHEGDSIYFDPTRPHSQKAIGDKKARFLTVIVE